MNRPQSAVTITDDAAREFYFNKLCLKIKELTNRLAEDSKDGTREVCAFDGLPTQFKLRVAKRFQVLFSFEGSQVTLALEDAMLLKDVLD